jgi:hypothetical protein
MKSNHRITCIFGMFCIEISEEAKCSLSEMGWFLLDLTVLSPRPVRHLPAAGRAAGHVSPDEGIA